MPTFRAIRCRGVGPSAARADGTALKLLAALPHHGMLSSLGLALGHKRDPGRRLSGNSNLLVPRMYPPHRPDHRIGYIGDFTDSSPPRPLKAFSGAVPKNALRTVVEGGRTDRLVCASCRCRYTPAFLLPAAEQPLRLKRHAVRAHRVNGQGQPTHDPNQRS